MTRFALIAAAAITLTPLAFSAPAHAGNRDGGILSRIFGGGPHTSIYRERRPEVRGFRVRVGGYSYNKRESFDYKPLPIQDQPRDFGPHLDFPAVTQTTIPQGPYPN